MNLLLPIFILIPLLGFIISFFLPAKNEKLHSGNAFVTAGLHFLFSIFYIINWLIGKETDYNIKEFVLYRSKEYEFFVDFYFDKVTAVYLFVGALLTFLVAIYSRYYLHRERGYTRFFSTILAFYLGYNIAIFSGNFETLFIGWEILGICSFLLIVFYRDRILPVRNAVKVFSIYRIGDVGLIIAMWMSHHLWQENITFLKLNNALMVHEHLQSHSMIGVTISLMVLVTAAAKSAQLPFTSWLPRAMEGPTPSSAIFYGSLSVHLGVFLMLRTFPFWEQQISFRIFIGVLGLLTSIVSSSIARVQSSVKSQIAYASAAQIGLIFIELALGFKMLALIHFAGNAFLRTYQLLVSPSVVSYMIREQFYNYFPRVQPKRNILITRLTYTFYVLSLKEWNLDRLLDKILWNPIKQAGKQLKFITAQWVLFLFAPIYAICLYVLYHEGEMHVAIPHTLPVLFTLIGLLMVMKSYAERKDFRLSWLLICMNHFWIALAVSFNEHFSFNEVHLYLSGIFISGLIGYLILNKLYKQHSDLNLWEFHGLIHRGKTYAVLFFFCCLALAGFPITPTFVGEDLIFSHIHEEQYFLAVFCALSYVLDGLAIIRIYARIFLGPERTHSNPVSYSSL